MKFDCGNNHSTSSGAFRMRPTVGAKAKSRLAQFVGKDIRNTTHKVHRQVGTLILQNVALKNGQIHPLKAPEWPGAPGALQGKAQTKPESGWPSVRGKHAE